MILEFTHYLCYYAALQQLLTSPPPPPLSFLFFSSFCPFILFLMLFSDCTHYLCHSLTALGFPFSSSSSFFFFFFFFFFLFCPLNLLPSLISLFYHSYSSQIEQCQGDVTSLVCVKHFYAMLCLVQQVWVLTASCSDGDLETI